MLAPLRQEYVDEMARLMPEYAGLLNQVDISSYEKDTHAGAALLYYDKSTQYTKLLAIGGLVVCLGVAQTWLVVSHDGMNHPRALGLGAKHFLIRDLKRGLYHRLEARVHFKHEKAAGFVEALGFVNEGRNRLYYQDGDDAYLYAWTVS